MATSTSSRNLRDGIITIRDASNVYEVVLEDGDLSFTETQNVIEVMDRGSLDHVRKGDDVPVSLSFTAKYVQLRDAAADTLYDVLKKTGNAASWATTGGAGEDVHLLTLTFIIRTPVSAGNDEYISFTRMYHTALTIAEGSEFNTISFTGQASIVAPTIAVS